MLSLILIATTAPRSALFFNALERTHTVVQAGSVNAKVSTKDSSGESAKSYQVKYRWPSELRLREHDGSGKLIHDRVISADRAIDYDPALEQYIDTRRSADSTLGNTLASIDGTLDDLVLAFCEPKALGVWLEPFKSLAGWKVSRKGSTVEASYQGSGNTILLAANAVSARLIRIRMQSSSNTIDWQLTYDRTVTGITFAKPPLASKVHAFDTQMLPPSFASKEARSIAESMFNAYEGLSSLGYVVKRPGGKTTVVLAGKFVRQEDERSRMTYDGKTLLLEDLVSHKWYKAELGFNDVIDAVASVGARVDPTLRLLMTGTNPYRKRLGDRTSVRLVGKMRANGEDVALLTAQSDNSILTLGVRLRDGLVVSSIARANDEGELGSQVVELGYDYFSVPTDAPKKYALAVPKGTKTSAFTPAKKSN